MTVEENIKSMMVGLVESVKSENLEENGGLYNELKDIYKKDPVGFLEKLSFADIKFQMLLDKIFNIPNEEHEYLMQFMANGLYRHFHETRIEKLEGFSCCADKSGFIQDMTFKAIKENTNLSLYDDYSKIAHMKDNHKGRAYWSPTSVKDTDEAIALFFEWYNLGNVTS